MKILVTGSSGFLGRHLCRELERREHELTKLTSADTIWPRDKYDQIYHLAAWTQAGDFCLTHQGEQWLINQEINTKALSYWRHCAPQAKFITIGSSCAYAPGGNLKEDDYLKGEPHESLYTYGMTKRMLFDGCRAINKQFSLKYLYAIPSTLYGPDYHTDHRQSHFIYDLIKKIIKGKELNQRVVLWGDGYQNRELIYVEDFVRLLLMLNDKKDNDIFNISAGRSYTIRHFAHVICEIVGYDQRDIKYDQDEYIGAKQKSLSSNKLYGALGYYDTTPLTVGVRRTVEWVYQTGVWR